MLIFKRISQSIEKQHFIHKNNTIKKSSYKLSKTYLQTHTTIEISFGMRRNSPYCRLVKTGK